MKDYLERRISKIEKRVNNLKASHGDDPGNTHTYHGGWDLGYWEGMLTAYHNIQDKLDKEQS